MCLICFTDIPKSNMVQCFCENQMCKECVKVDLLMNEGEPKCPKCNIGWTRKFMFENLTKTWTTTI